MLSLQMMAEIFMILFLNFQDKVSLSLQRLETISIDQTDFELRDLPVSASLVLALKVCTTTTQTLFFLT